MVVPAAPSSPLSIKIGDITEKLLSMGRSQDVPGGRNYKDHKHTV